MIDPDRGGEPLIVCHDLVEPVLAVFDQVHLVHRQHEVTDAEQLAEVGMPPGLDQHALARIDQDHGKVRGARPGHHVAGVLLMPRAIGDDELALLGGEEAVGDVDRDALLALGGQAIDQQGEVDLLPLRADPL